MNDFNQFKAIMKEIVTNWGKNIKLGIEEQGSYGEHNTRVYLIDPILKALNWVDDGSKKIIDNEFSIKHKTSTGSADYALKIDNVPKILIEAKDVAKVKDLINEYDTIHGFKRTYPRQLTEYCHDLNHQGFQIKFAILTNGKEWILYNMQYADISSEREIIFHLDIEELDEEDNLEKLWALEYNDFVKDQFRLKELIQQLYDYRLSIDKKAVQNLLECKELLSNSIFDDYEKNKRGIKVQIDRILEDDKKVNGMPAFKDISKEDRLTFFIKEASSSIINKILFIRILEDKNFLKPKLTKRGIEEWKDYRQYRDYKEIMELFREACGESERLYNGGLFRINPYDNINYDSEIIKQIIDILGDITFREIDSDIIGRIYEIYLGQVLKVESEIHGKKRTSYKADNKGRKKLGQYYTPKFVVSFIVKNTLGKIIEGKKPEEISKIRILDPACGSGSFLINAYDILSGYFEDWNNKMLKKILEEAKDKGESLAAYSNNDIIPNYKNIILRENIHGVDLNDLSVQICEINLWLRALERNKKLIKLNKNILNGNSLITGIEEEKEISEYKNDIEEIKKRTMEIKDYYDKDELTEEEESRLAALERRLKVLKDKINTKINENLEDYFGKNINAVHPFNWEIEFPQVMQEGGFDIVIGNPPYVKVHDIPKDERDFYLGYYKGISKKMDLYLLFIEKGISLLKKGGFFAYIIPSNFIHAKYGQKIKKYILNNCKIIEFIDFGDLQVFEDATNYPCILILQKIDEKNNKIKYVKIKELDENILLDKEEITKNKEIFYVNQNSLNEKTWSFISEEKQKIFHKIGKNGDKKLFEICESISTGAQTSADKIYILRGSDKEIKEIEKNMFKPALFGKNVRKWILTGEKNFMIYPYQRLDNKTEIIKEEELKEKYPKCYKYLIKNKDDIVKRVIGGAGPWYRYANTGNPNTFEQLKIITPALSNKNNFYLDEDNNYFVCGSAGVYSIILKDKLKTKENYLFYTGLLNSKIIEFYIKYISPIFSGGYYKYNTQYLNELPVVLPTKNIEITNNLIERTEKILVLNKNYYQILDIFSKIVNNYSIAKEEYCTFKQYFTVSEMYKFEKRTLNNINKIDGTIKEIKIREADSDLIIYVTYKNKESDKEFKNIEAIRMTIKDNNLRKFLFLSLKNSLRSRSFGSGNLLNNILKLYVPFYINPITENLKVIENIMKEFNYETKELFWENKAKEEKFTSLTDIEDKIDRIDGEIDELVYELYGITKDEKKIIEEILK